MATQTTTEFHLKNQNLKPLRIPPKGQEEEDEETLLSPMACLFHEPDYNFYVLSIIGWKGKVDVEKIKEDLTQTVLKHPRFTSLQVMNKNGKMTWVPTKVDLDKHVIVPEVDPHMESPEQFVEDYVSSMTRADITAAKPMWEFHVLKVKTSEFESVGVFRVHHSLGDGTSLMSLLLASARKASDPTALPSIPRTNSMAKQSKVNLFYRLWLLLTVFLRTLYNSAADLLMFVATALFLKDSKTPLRGPMVTPSCRRVIYRSVSLDEIKMVKNAMNVTVNDVVMGIIQAALTRYLNRRYGSEDEGKTKDNLPKKMLFRAFTVMNLRSVGGVHALDDMMKKDAKAKYGNTFTFVLVPLTIAKHDDPLIHVHNAKATMDRKKQSYDAQISLFIADLTLKIFGSKVASAISSRVANRATLLFSNVIGPSEEISLFGQPVGLIAPTCFGQPGGLMIHVISYVNKLTFVVSVDKETVPDPHQLGDDLVGSFQPIKDAVLKKKK